ncbi:MAG: thioredoxin [Ruminococcus sp.]|nr:thioredoxin [Ruminococcus sp.]
MSNIYIQSADEFSGKVLSADRPVIVDFFAEWCGPCKMLAPIIEDIAENEQGMLVFKVNVDEVPELADKYGVSSIPTLIAFEKGEEKKRHVGLTDRDGVMALTD